jgi:hypothetical protein
LPEDLPGNNFKKCLTHPENATSIDPFPDKPDQCFVLNITIHTRDLDLTEITKKNMILMWISERTALYRAFPALRLFAFPRNCRQMSQILCTRLPHGHPEDHAQQFYYFQTSFSTQSVTRFPGRYWDTA